MSVLTEILISSLFSLLLSSGDGPKQIESEQQPVVVEMAPEKPVQECAPYEPKN